MTKRIPESRVRIKRAYEPPEGADGLRILVDRLWPRGIRKEDARIDEWVKDLSPSTGLRKWYGHDPDLWPEFRKRYAAEMKEHGDELERLRALARKSTVTLIFSSHEEVRNNAAALREMLLKP